MGLPARLLSQPSPLYANVCRWLSARRGYPGKLFLSLICPWHSLHRGTETGAACLSCHLKVQKYHRWSVTAPTGSPAPKMRMSANSCQSEGASLESCYSASSAHGTARTEPQRPGLLACLATSNLKRSLRKGVCLLG